MLSKRSDVPLANGFSLFHQGYAEGRVKVYFYAKGFMHSKTMTFDTSLTLIGSANFDSRSFEQNFEVEAFIYDEEVTLEANEIFVKTSGI